MKEHHQRLYNQALLDAAARFNPDLGLVRSGAMGDTADDTYRPAASLPYAHALLKEGDPSSVRTAARIIEAVLDSQETRTDRPHRGNFRWLFGDPEVADLNAVQFVVRDLMPCLVQFSSLLPDTLLEDCRTALRLALEEQERLDVAPTYTNIHLMSLFALLIGGAWLDDRHFYSLGQKRWEAFASYTLASGAPHEYNSTNYGPVDINTLAGLIDFEADPAIRLQAELIFERFWLHLMLHFHGPTGQLAGPHSRSYWVPMTRGHSMLGDLIWLQTGWDWLLPAAEHAGQITMESLYALHMLLSYRPWPGYLKDWLEKQTERMPYEVRETADPSRETELTSYFTAGYALGTASHTYSIGTDCYYIEHQANYLCLHYLRPEKEKAWGMVYSRFVVNDRHWGTLAAAHDRPKDANFYEQGNFAGNQLRNKAVGMYALEPVQAEVTSLKTLVCFDAGKDLQEIWVGDRDVSSQIPTAVEPEKWLVIKDGVVLVGVKSLAYSQLGPGAGIQLERGPLGETWLVISHYRGAPKRFWEYASLGGAFWRGNIQAGFVIEVAEVNDFSSVQDFLEHLEKAKVIDEVNADHIRTVSYHSGGESIRLDYDLWNTRPAGRWLNNRRNQPQELLSPLAVQASSGKLSLGKAALQANSQPIWLIAEEKASHQSSFWTAVNPSRKHTPLVFDTGLGQIRAESWGMGRISCVSAPGEQGKILIEGLEKPQGLEVPEGIPVHFRLAGRES